MHFLYLANGRRYMVEIKRILVPLDGSELSEAALPLALSLAEKYNAQIILLRAVEQTANLSYVTHADALQLRARLVEALSLEVPLYLRDKQQDLRRQGYNVEIAMADGSPAESIIKAATHRDIDMVVMSTHGRGGLARWTAGSVAEKVLRYCPCPVLLVRQGIMLE
jgi:nucleotide-binding universal stress UspA family protein